MLEGRNAEFVREARICQIVDVCLSKSAVFCCGLCMVVPRMWASGFKLGLAPLYDRQSLVSVPQAIVV